MTREEMKSFFSEAAGEVVKPLIDAAVADIRKEFTPMTEEMKTVKDDYTVIRQAAKREHIEAFVETHLKPNKNGESRIQAYELDNTSGLPTIIDDLMALDNKTPTVKFSEGNGSEVMLTPLDAAMKKIAKRPPRKFSEKVKSDGKVAGSTDLEQDKASYEAFCEEAGPLASGNKDEVWKHLENMDPEGRKKHIRSLHKYLEASKAGV